MNFSFLLGLIFIIFKEFNLLVSFHFFQLFMENFFKLLLIYLFYEFLLFLILHLYLSFSFKEEDHQILSRRYYNMWKHFNFDNFLNYSFKFILLLELELLF